MKHRWAVRVAYIASEEYYGYQKQPHKRTIEGTIESALQQAEIPATFGTKTFVSSGRTDRLVSALKQTICFDLPKDMELNLMRINAHLPPTIHLWAVALVPSDFHPRYHAIKREYHYFFPLLPLQKETLNLSVMTECLELLKGTHDFQNFAKSADSSNQKTIRTLEEATISLINDRIIAFKFVSQGFLWQQVRRMVSHVLQVGLGEVTLETTEELLTKHKKKINPQLIPSPAPPEGLILSNVQYDSQIIFNSDFSSIKVFQRKMHDHLQRLMMKAHVLDFTMTYLSKEMGNINGKRK